MKKLFLLSLPIALLFTFSCDNEPEEPNTPEMAAINVSTIETIQNELKLIAVGMITDKSIDPYNDNSQHDDWGEAFF